MNIHDVVEPRDIFFQQHWEEYYFCRKRTQKLSPGLIKDQHGLFYFFGRSLLSTTITSILIQNGGRMKISKMGLILPYDFFLNMHEILPNDY